MDRLFTSINPNKTFRTMNRLDLFEILFNDRQKVIDQLEDEATKLTKLAFGQYNSIDDFEEAKRKFLEE